MTQDQDLPDTPPAPARILWDDDDQPRSADFEDIYFSTRDGLAESRHVYLDGNDLAARWRRLSDHDPFVIGETGFGTGLNFLAAWTLWRDSAPPAARLHYLGVEAFPLAPDDLDRALSAWPELKERAAALAAAYPACLAPGLHQLVFDAGRVRLTLALAEAATGLDAFLDSAHPRHRRPRRGVDAWFLDGFAPAKNPEMWRPAVLERLQALSAPGATFATFTAAGAVRRGLRDHGFEVRKAPGFGRKRDMLRGRLVRPATRPAAAEFPASPYPDGRPHAWHLIADAPPPGAQTRVAVIGGGLAGCHAARALARRGLSVTVFEAEPDLARGGSGNAQGVLYAKPAPGGGLAADFSLAALLFAQRHYRALWDRDDPCLGAACGVLHLAADEREAGGQATLVERLGAPALCRQLERSEAEDIAGVPLPAGGLWFPASGWLSPPAVCRALIAGIEPADRPLGVRQARVARLAPDPGGGWRLFDEQDRLLADAGHVVLACANALAGFAQCAALPVQPVRGQVSRVDTGRAPAAGRLRVALCAEGYVTPARDGRISFGASFHPGDAAVDTRAVEHAHNLARLRRNVPGLVPDDVIPEDCGGRAGLRCATPDRLPITGPVPDRDRMVERFALLRKNANAAIADAGAWHEGLWVSAGYGSKGLAYIPLASEWLASQIIGEPPPLGPELRVGLSPARFLIRDLKRGRA